MFYFHRSSHPIQKGQSKESIVSELREKFEITEKKDHLKLVRNRIIGNRGILRLFFPKLVTKMTIDREVVYLKTKLDGVGLFMLIMIVGGIIVEFTMDRAIYPREYPFWVPILFLIVFVGTVAFEVSRINKNFNQNR